MKGLVASTNTSTDQTQALTEVNTEFKENSGGITTGSFTTGS